MNTEKNPEQLSATQEALSNVTTICDAELSKLRSDNIAYLRTPDSTILVHRHRDKHPKNDMIGDYEVWILNWLNPVQPGYGAHTLTRYQLFTETNGIRAQRLFEENDSNGDPREDQNQDEIFDPIDDNPEFDPIVPPSEEHILEAAKRFFGIDPDKTHDVDQAEAENLSRLLLSAEPTRDPYFER